MVAADAGMRHSHSTASSTKKWDTGCSVNEIQSLNNNGETVTLTKAELKSLLDAAIGQNPSPNGYVDFYNDVTYDVKNDDAGEENGYPAFLDGSPMPGHQISRTQSFKNYKGNSLPSSEMRINTTRSYQNVGSGNSATSNSKLDQKRRQWEKEKQELMQWDPWGKPGGGAPRQRSQSLNHVPCSSSLPYSDRSALTSSQTKPNAQYRDPSKYSLRSSIGSTTVSSQRIPEYLKSNLPFGPNYSNLTDDLQGVWSKDELGNATFKSDVTANPWFENSDTARHSSYSGLISPTQSISNTKTESFARGQGLFQSDSTQLEKIQKAKEYREYIEAQMVEKQRKQQEERDRKRKEEEEEERRLEEERKLIQRQFEDEQKKLKEKEELVERKRLVLLEAVKNAQEAAEAEKKAKIALKRNQGRCMVRDNNTTASPSHARNSTSSDAHVDVTIKHHEVKVSPESPRHQTDDFKLSQDLSNFAAWINGDNQKFTKAQESVQVKSQQMATVYPMQSQFNSSEPAFKETKEFGIQTEPSLSPYVQNRLLTPSQWRINERLNHLSRSSGITPANVWGFNRDMSTQTEINQNLEWKNSYHVFRKKPEHSDYAICSSSSSTCSSATLERSGIKQMSKLPSKSDNQDTVLTNQPESDNKPKWGVNKPSKNFVKMTERDPNCRRRKKLQEMRKQHWQKELATQKAMTQTKRMVLASKQETNCNVETEASNPYKKYQDTKSGNLSSTYTLAPSQKVFARVPPVQVNCDINKNTTLILPPLSGRWSRSSDSLPNVMFRDLTLDCSPVNVPNYACGAMKVLGHFDSRSEIYEQPIRRKWHSQENFQPAFTKTGKSQYGEEVHDSGVSSLLRKSGNGCDTTNSSNINESNGSSSASEDADDTYGQGVVIPTPRRKWSEQDNFDLDKIALLQAVLNRKELDRAIAGSSNATDLEKSPPHAISKNRATSESSVLHAIEQSVHTVEQSAMMPQAISVDKDPLVNPNVVIERPTPRQDKILQQLSTLRRGLLLKQQEIESRLRKPESPMETKTIYN